jgi:hypothetical protein
MAVRNFTTYLAAEEAKNVPGSLSVDSQIVHLSLW